MRIQALRTVLVVSLLLFVSAPGSAAGPPSKVLAVVVGVGNHSGGAKFLKVPLSRVVLIGHPEDLGKLLGLNSYFEYASCECILTPGPLGECMVREAPRAEVPVALRGLKEGNVVVQAEPQEFAAVFNQARAGGSGGGPPRPPTVVLPPANQNRIAPLCREAGPCEAASNVEVNANGETKFTVGCEGGVQVEFSTTGSVDLKLGAGPVTMVVPAKEAAR